MLTPIPTTTPFLSWILKSCFTRMIMLLFGGRLLDYSDRNALIMMCGSSSSEVSFKKTNVKSLPMTSNYLRIHTHLPILILALELLIALMSLMSLRESGAQAAVDSHHCAFVCVSGHLTACLETQKQWDRQRISCVCCKAVRAVSMFTIYIS